MLSQIIQGLNKKHLHGPYNVLKKVCTLLNSINNSIKQFDTNTVIIEKVTSFLDYLDKIANKKIGYLYYGDEQQITIKYAQQNGEKLDFLLVDLCNIDLSKLNKEFIQLENTGHLSDICPQYVENIIKQLCANIKQISLMINTNEEKIIVEKIIEKKIDNNKSLNIFKKSCIKVRERSDSHKDCRSVCRKKYNDVCNNYVSDTSSSSESCDKKYTRNDSHKDCHGVCKKKYSDDCNSDTNKHSNSSNKYCDKDTSSSDTKKCTSSSDTKKCTSSSKTKYVEPPKCKPDCNDDNKGRRGNIIKCICKLYTGLCTNNICHAPDGQFVGQYIIDTEDGSIYQWSGTEWANTVINLPCYYLCVCGILYYVCVHNNILCIYNYAEYYNLICGDIIIDTETGNLLTLKYSGKWKISCNITGPTGPTGPSGPIEPCFVNNSIQSGSIMVPYNSGITPITNETYFIGQCYVIDAGIITPNNFPNANPSTIGKFNTASLLFPDNGTIISYSAVLKTPSTGSMYHVYLAALNVAGNSLRLLSTKYIELTDIELCDNLIINEPIYAWETLAPWVMTINAGTNSGISVTLTLAI